MPKKTPIYNERALQELSLLHQIGNILDQSLDMRDVVQPVLKAIAESPLEFRYTTITLLKPGTEEILIEAAHGLSPAQMRKGHYKLGEGVTGQVVLTGEPMIIERTGQSHLFLNRTGRNKTDTSFICVPIKAEQEVLGALSVDRAYMPGAAAQLEADATFLSVVASMIGRAVMLRRAAQQACDTLTEENRRLRRELAQRYHPSEIIGTSREMQGVFDQIAQVAKSQATVLICGETGTGKERIAQAICAASKRAQAPFIRVHCAALPESLIESELFGHVKGAFTGATSDRIGRFEAADGGTLFLDEIGEIPLSIQAKLLRVLQERTFEPVGSTRSKKVDIRIIAATHRDLPEMVRENRFREDLYYRISTFPIYVPPLRKRQSDIILLADHFLTKYAQKNDVAPARLSNAAIDLLVSYRWPGNVRELENCMERASLLAAGSVVLPAHLPPSLQTAQSASSSTAPTGTLAQQVGAFEKAVIEEALRTTKGNMAAAARALGTTARILAYKAKHYQLTD